MLTIKLTTEKDADTLTEIQKAAFLPLYDIYHDEGNPALRGPEDILNRLNRPTYRCWNILYDEVLVGGVIYRKLGEGEYYLQRIYIAPEFHNRGFASSAIMICEKEFPDAKKFTVEFPADRIMNRKCYEKAGYKDTGERRQLSSLLTLAIYERIV